MSRHGRRAWPIEVELLPWSSTTCEVGLRFVGRNVPSGRRVGDYHELATAAVRTLATCVRAQPPRTVVIDAPPVMGGIDTEADLMRANTLWENLFAGRP